MTIKQSLAIIINKSNRKATTKQSKHTKHEQSNNNNDKITTKATGKQQSKKATGKQQPKKANTLTLTKHLQ